MSAVSGDKRRQFIQQLVSHEIRLRAFALSLAGNWDVAEDILQDAMCVLWEKLDDFQAGTDFMAWAGRVVYLKACEHRRRQGKAAGVAFGEEFLAKVAEEAPRLSDEMVERQSLLQDCIDKLRPDHKKLLKLRYERGADIVGIAQSQSRSAGSVRETLRRVRRLLFDCVTRRQAAGGLA
jgi:RNA polymerase sigma-70 factor (ECF subfamily)